MTLPTTFKEWMERYTSDPDFRRHIDNRNKVPKPRKAPKPEGIHQCISRFKRQAALLDHAHQWENAALRYFHWLQEEGFTNYRSLEIIDTTLEQANFDLGKFPMCS